MQDQIAVTLLQNEVRFAGEEKPVKLLIALAASDNNRHLDALMSISEILQNEDTVQKILNSKDKEELYSYFE